MGDFVIGDSVNVETYVDFNASVGAVVGNATVNICSYCKDDEEEKDQDYIPSNKEWFDNLLGYNYIEKTVYSASDSKYKWILVVMMMMLILQYVKDLRVSSDEESKFLAISMNL